MTRENALLTEEELVLTRAEFYLSGVPQEVVRTTQNLMQRFVGTPNDCDSWQWILRETTRSLNMLNLGQVKGEMCHHRSFDPPWATTTLNLYCPDWPVKLSLHYADPGVPWADEALLRGRRGR